MPKKPDLKIVPGNEFSDATKTNRLMRMIIESQQVDQIADLEASIKYTMGQAEKMREKFQQLNYFLAEMRKRLKELKRDVTQ